MAGTQERKALKLVGLLCAGLGTIDGALGCVFGFGGGLFGVGFGFVVGLFRSLFHAVPGIFGGVFGVGAGVLHILLGGGVLRRQRDGPGWDGQESDREKEGGDAEGRFHIEEDS